MSKIIDLTGLQKILSLFKGKLDKKVEFSEFNKTKLEDTDASLINSRFLNTGKWDLIKFPPVNGKHNYIGAINLNNNKNLLTFNNEYIVKGSNYSGGYQLFIGDIPDNNSYNVALGVYGTKKGNVVSAGGSLRFASTNNVSTISVVGATLEAPEISTTALKFTRGIKMGRAFGTNDPFIEVGLYGFKSNNLGDYNSVYSTHGNQTKKSIQTFFVDLSDPKYDNNKFYKLQAPLNQNIFYGEMVIYKINPKWRGYNKPEVLYNITDKISFSDDSNTVMCSGILHFKYVNGESGLQNIKLEFSSQNKEQSEDKIWAIHQFNNPKSICIRGGGKYFISLMNFFVTENRANVSSVKWNEVFIDSNFTPIPYWKDSVLTL